MMETDVEFKAQLLARIQAVLDKIALALEVVQDKHMYYELHETKEEALWLFDTIAKEDRHGPD